MNLEIFTPCKDCERSPKGDGISIRETFAGILTDDIPYILEDCFIAVAIRFNRHEFGAHKFEMRFTDPDTEYVLSIKKKRETRERHANDHSTLVSIPFRFPRVKLPTFGTYSFSLVVDDKPLYSIPFVVAHLS